jgi:hypothetical protein
MANVPIKNPSFDDAAKTKFADAVAIMLKVQIAASGCESVDNADGAINSRALGYMYGFIDAALRTIGQDMADLSVGVPMTFQIFRRLFPGSEERYVQFFRAGLQKDVGMTTAMMVGGQQYIDFNNGKVVAPMGLSRILIGAA